MNINLNFTHIGVAKLMSKGNLLFNYLKSNQEALKRTRPAEIDDYYKVTAISASLAKEALKSKYDAYLMLNKIQEKESPSLRFGTLTHLVLLEHGRFLKETVVAPEFNKRSKIGKEFLADFEKENAGKIIVSAKEMDQLFEIREKAFRNEKFSYLFETAKKEEEVYFLGENPKSSFKSKLDLSNKFMVLDIKTTPDASLKAFSRDFFNFNYDVQLRFYGILNALSCGLESEFELRFFILAIERSLTGLSTNEPALYDVSDVVLSENTLNKLNHGINISSEVFGLKEIPKKYEDLVFLEKPIWIKE